MIHHTVGARQPTILPAKRTPIRAYKPGNAPNVTACVTCHDPNLGIVAHSIRSNLGVMSASTSIHWDVGVFNCLVADGVQWLECFIKTTGKTYRCHVDMMLAHGQQQHRFGLQWVLHLKYWQVDGEPAEFERQAEPAATRAPALSHKQPTLFDLGGKMAVYR